jgi:hypothetical protein
VSVREVFNQARMDRAMAVFRTVHNASARAGKPVFKVVSDGPVEGKTLDELKAMYFDVGAGGDLTALPFLDTLVVFGMFVKQLESLHKGKGPVTRGVMVTAFTDEVAGRLFDGLKGMFGVAVRSAPPAA